MTEQGLGNGRERRMAHERLSTGALARWMRACATHPWRVVLGWLGIVALLIALVSTVGGQLKDEFEIPGSDTQRATDLIEAEFASEQGGVLNLVFAAPEGQRLDTPERRAAIQEAVARVRSDEFAPTEDEAGIESVGNPFAQDTFSDDGRIAYAEAQFDRIIYEEDRPSVLAVQEAVRETAEPAGVIVAGLTDINTITPLLVSMIGLGVGIDYSLFIVTRFRQLLHEGLSPADAAAEAGASAGRAVLFAGLTVAISVTGLAFFGLDFITKLGIGSALGVLTTVLIATSLLPAVL